MSRRSPVRAVLLGALASVSLAAAPAWAALSVTVSGTQSGTTAYPGFAIRVFTLSITNNDSPTLGTSATLTSVTFTNGTTSSGGGSAAQRDQDWQTLQLWDQIPSIIDNGTSGTGTSIQQIPDEPTPSPIAYATFGNGTARFSGFAEVIKPGTTVRLYVIGGASLTAHDADDLDLGIASASAMTFSNAGLVNGTFPISPSGDFPVDGMVAAQITRYAVNTPTFAVGSVRNLALDVRLPANGYQADVLQRLAVQNLGSARPGDEITNIEVWLDDGDGAFQPALDTRLGAMGFTGDRWQLSGLSVPLPVGGKRIFVSVDLGELAEAGRTVRLSLPTYPSGSTDPSFLGVGVSSDDDGPVDQAVSNPSAQALAVVDRVVLAGKPVSAGAIAPGQPGAILLQLVATNTYSVDKTLTALTASNATTGPGTQDERDGELQAVALRADADGDGVLEPTDPTLATGLFFAGRATFRGFAWRLPAG